MPVKTYDPLTVKVVYGVFPLGGFAKKSAIHVERESNTFNRVRGINGKVCRHRTLFKGGQITLTLQQTSMSNAILSSLTLVDDNFAVAILPFVILDIANGSTMLSAKAWVRKPADIVYSEDLSERVWIFECADIDIFANGNLS